MILVDSIWRKIISKTGAADSFPPIVPGTPVFFISLLEHHVKISNEAIALFVRFWLTTTPALPGAARAAAQASGNERYRGFIEALGRRIEKGQNLSVELAQDIDPGPQE
jgi:hypothetical protein